MVSVGAQVHIWRPDAQQRPWPPSGAHQAHAPIALGKAKLLREMDAAGVDRVIVIPPSGVGSRDDLALEASPHPSIALKTSARACCVTEPDPFPNLHQHIGRAIDGNGRQRIFWGTDLTWLSGPYRQAATLFTEELDCLSDEDREWRMGRGIAEWLG